MSEMKRLNKYISESGFCSRRDADAYIEKGKVKVNGVVGTIGTQVTAKDQVTVNDRLIDTQVEKVYIAFNKPVGITSTTDHKDPTNIVDYISHEQRIFPIGRLDKDSEGLIFLTNDGDIVNAILRAGNNHEKEYIVTVDKVLTKDFITRMSKGVPVHHTVTLPCRVELLKSHTFRIVLKQGLNRQIRLMCEHFGYEVTRLKRIRIMNVDLTGIETGDWRNLTKGEVNIIKELIKNSSNTKEASKVSKKNQDEVGHKKPYVRNPIKETKGRGKSPRYAQRKKKASSK